MLRTRERREAKSLPYDGDTKPDAYTINLRHSLSQPVRAASSLREGAKGTSCLRADAIRPTEPISKISEKKRKKMKYIKQFLIILAISCAGELLARWIPAPIPASIYGIVLLFIGLVTGAVPYDSVKETGHFLIDIMPIMFVPAAAGLLDSWQLIASSWIEYGLLIVVTTVAVMGVAGRVTQRIAERGKIHA